MQVQVLLFAALRERANAGQWTQTLPENSTLGQLLQTLEQRWPFLKQARFATAVNGEVVESSRRLHDGDEVALLPPVSGG